MSRATLMDRSNQVDNHRKHQALRDSALHVCWGNNELGTLQRAYDLSAFQRGIFPELLHHVRAARRALPHHSLGLITLAAMLPAHWTVRLVNRNTETLDEADLDWADLVMTGGMLFQQADSLRLIRRAQARGKPIAIGGPDATSSAHIYAAADFRVLGEAEGIIADFVAAWEAGERAGDFHAPKYQVDVTRSPIPRFDLLRFQDYLFVGVQFSRGCPFTCEFCDIIELYGRVPRTKDTRQINRCD